MKILIVDDSSEVRRSLMMLLEDNNHKVLTAENKDQALGFIDRPTNAVKWQTELVITDLDMGKGTDGFELIREARMKHPSVKFWLVSVDMTEEITTEAKRLGAERAVSKFDLNQALKEAGILT